MPHFVKFDQALQHIGSYANGFFTVWNPGTEELTDIQWMAEHSHSVESDPLITVPHTQQAASTSPPTWPGGGGGGTASDVLLVPQQWDDLRISVSSLQSRGGGLDPTKLIWNAGSIPVYDIGEEQSFVSQMPHRYKEGTDLRPHIHWTPHSRGVAEAGNTVNWQLEIAIANVNTVFPTPTLYNYPVTCSGTNDLHQIASSQTIPGAGLTISHIIVGTVRRIAGDTWVGNDPANLRPGLLEIDFHYQLDTLGSKTETSKT
jgi:hypothetical protein